MSTSPSDELILDRLRTIEAAKDDLCIAAQRERTVAERSDPVDEIMRGRMVHLLGTIAHMKDTLKKFARLRGLDAKDVDEFSESCRAISLCKKVHDTYKHGFGGRSENNAAIIGNAVVYKLANADEIGATDQSIVAAWIISDGSGQCYDGMDVAKWAMVLWLRFIDSKFGIRYQEWADRVIGRLQIIRPITKPASG